MAQNAAEREHAEYVRRAPEREAAWRAELEQRADKLQQIEPMSREDAQAWVDGPIIACACIGDLYCCAVRYYLARRILGQPV